MRGMQLLTTSFALALASTAVASSHREAPFITEHPKVDATDFYMFRSYEAGRADYVTIVANYLPLQDPYGGPNYFTLDPEALYEIHVDNDGDARQDMTFQFRFKATHKNFQLNVGGVPVSVPLVNIGGIVAGDQSNLNLNLSYTMSLVTNQTSDATSTTVKLRDLATNLPTFPQPFDYIGEKSFPDYPGYAASFVRDFKLPNGGGNGRVFVGQRKDPFVVNLGEIFDLVNIENPIGPNNVENDDLADKNVTSIIIELPISFLTQGHGDIIGGWTTASLRQNAVLRTNPTFAAPETTSGSWIQVSRLSNPLVNEVVIGLADKNKFNNSVPRNDRQFLKYVTNPTLPALLEILFGSAGVQAPTLFPREDLVAAFLTGVDGLNKFGRPCEYIRLNTAIEPVAANLQNPLGVIGGDVAGFPNGRRPGDDVVDIALRVVMGRLINLGLFGDPSQAPSGGLDFTDGAYIDANMFDVSFPYLRTPIPGSRF